MTKQQKIDASIKDEYNLYDFLIDEVGLTEKEAQDIWNEKYEKEYNTQNLNCFI